jgi:hypothetical protein
MRERCAGGSANDCESRRCIAAAAGSVRCCVGGVVERLGGRHPSHRAPALWSARWRSPLGQHGVLLRVFSELRKRLLERHFSPAGIKPSLADYLSQILSNDPDIERWIPRKRAPAIAGITHYRDVAPGVTGTVARCRTDLRIAMIAPASTCLAPRGTNRRQFCIAEAAIYEQIGQFYLGSDQFIY